MRCVVFAGQVFILLDKPDDEMDALLSDHVMKLHGGKRRRASEYPPLDNFLR